MRLSGAGAMELLGGWASVAQPLAQTRGMARGGTGGFGDFEVENNNRGLARPLQKGAASRTGAGLVVLAEKPCNLILSFGGGHWRPGFKREVADDDRGSERLPLKQCSSRKGSRG